MTADARAHNLIYNAQAHERVWGEQPYPGRPDLAEILVAPVVVFWQQTGEDKRPQITLHQSLSELEAIFVRMVMRMSVETPKRRVWRIFKDGQLVIVRNISVTFGPPER